MSDTVRVLFVCLGNICRSPMAEAVFRHMVKEAGYEGRIEVFSSGTGDWHRGNPPHEGTQKVLREKGIGFDGVYAKSLSADEVNSYDYIVAMDNSNVDDLEGAGVPRPRIRLLSDFIPGRAGEEVPDPYFHGNFEEVYEMVEAGSRGLLKEIEKEKGWAS